MELLETKIELGKVLAKVDMLEKEKEGDCMEYDDWVTKVVKSMSAEGRTEFRNTIQMAGPPLTGKSYQVCERKKKKIICSYLLTNKSAEESELKKKIDHHVLENTIDVPDKKKFKILSFISANPLQCL